MKFVAPSIKLSAFNCPYCKAYAHQRWYSSQAGFSEIQAPQHYVDLQTAHHPPTLNTNAKAGGSWYVKNTFFSCCANCNRVAIWVRDRIVFPQTGDAPSANPDMPVDIRRDYDEADTILKYSPRGAAALIRLAIQKLCKELGQPGKNINHDIAALVAGGLDPRVQKALDAVRVIGNEAVHPGQIDLRDDRTIAVSLFKLLNLIVDKTISEPKHVDEIYAMLPEEKLKQIEKRDGGS